MNNNSLISFILVANPETFASMVSHMARSTKQRYPLATLGCILDLFFFCGLDACHTDHNNFNIAYVST
jgi:hypothetical protein